MVYEINIKYKVYILPLPKTSKKIQTHQFGVRRAVVQHPINRNGENWLLIKYSNVSNNRKRNTAKKCLDVDHIVPQRQSVSAVVL